MPERWCAACAFVRGFAYGECPLAGMTERDQRNGETEAKEEKKNSPGVETKIV